VTLKPATCHENATAFTITFLRNGSRQIAALVSARVCPTPGVVTLSEPGKTIQAFRETCAIRASVLAVLPNAKDAGTRKYRGNCPS
jgi:hypothetical protein